MPTTSIASADSRQMMKRALPMIAAGHRADVGVDQARMVTRIVLILKAATKDLCAGTGFEGHKKARTRRAFWAMVVGLIEIARGQGCLVRRRNIAGLGCADGLLYRGGGRGLLRHRGRLLGNVDRRRGLGIFHPVVTGQSGA